MVQTSSVWGNIRGMGTQKLGHGGIAVGLVLRPLILQILYLLHASLLSKCATTALPRWGSTPT
jgi:hypothetical protein